MVAGLAAVVQDIGIGAACFLQGIRQNGKATIIKGSFGQVTFVIGGLCQLGNGPTVPGQTSMLNGDRPKGQGAENTPNQSRLDGWFGPCRYSFMESGQFPLTLDD